MDRHKYNFPAIERLKQLNLFKLLLENGRASNLSPLRMTVYKIPFNGESNLQVAFSVPKRKFKRAVDRNLLKRRMRESYRLNCHDVREGIKNSDFTLLILFTYLNHEFKDYQTIESAMIRHLKSVEL